MENGLLSWIVKIKYPKESLTEVELEKGVSSFVDYLYFYGNGDDYDERMIKAWRPGAVCEVFAVSLENMGMKKAGKIFGAWENI